VAMLKVLEARKKSEEKGPPTPSYLYRAAYTAMVDELRRVQWKREVALEDDQGRTTAPLASTVPGPEQELHAAEIGRGIRDCLARLVQPRRLAVTLHLQGYSLAEAAGMLEWSAKRVDNLLYRGLADLRDCLSSKGLKP
jgi:RNA polymerase sigma-70 factor, ECF subfamily